MSTTITVFAPGGIAYLTSNTRGRTWQATARPRKAWREAARIAARDLGPQSPAVLTFVFEVPDNIRRDPQNLSDTVKPLVDGMIDAGCWKDDAPAFVTVAESTLRVVTGARFRRRVDITITERAT